MGFFEYISTHWYAGLALVLLVILTVFVCIMAMLSGRKRNAERERILADLQREKALREEFRTVDDSTFAQDKDDYRLIIGICANIQQRLEKSSDMNADFKKLSQPEQYAYALGYVFEDSKKGLSEFFRANGEPLLSVSAEAVRDVIGGEVSELFAKEYIMFDENDETTSIDSKVIEESDASYKEIIANDGDAVYRTVASYIRENKDCFIS